MKIVMCLLAVLNVLLMGGCVVAYGPSVCNRSERIIKVVAYEQKRGQLTEVVITNGITAFFGTEHLDLKSRINRIDCFADDGILLMSLSCRSNLFLNSETTIVIESE